ncbi:restriction endonuclease [Bacillus toyonensis]|uniref:restriction endonuclease n=1 Tax=Bacillus toyonensis TaxID=155322 RepID=UPI0020D21693|nr:restriction endonuclease [Bacillus toyonensis]
MINWDTVNPRHFEKFIFHVLAKKGFKNREWYGRGGSDRGRDVVATYYVELPFNLGYEQKWIFQCKRVKKCHNHHKFTMKLQQQNSIIPMRGCL